MTEYMGESRDTVKTWFWKTRASALLSVKQQRSLVIKERSRVGTKKKMAFPKALFRKGFGNRLINITKGSYNSQVVRLNKT